MNDPHPSWFERLMHTFSHEPQDLKSLLQLLQDAKNRELLDADALDMMKGVLQVSELKVRDIMIPRSKMIVIQEDMDPETAIPLVIKSAHSRFPVIAESQDKIVGILLAKDLLKLSADKTPQATIKSFLRPATFIPESKRLDILLKEFRLNRNHMAIVVDEYGGVAGLVTIEDVLEQIVGDIVDEYDVDEEESFIKQMGDNEYSVKALMPIEAFNEHFNTDYSNVDFDTIGGLILQKFSHVPKQGESIRFDDFEVTVIQAENRLIKLLRIKRLLHTHEE